MATTGLISSGESDRSGEEPVVESEMSGLPSMAGSFEGLVSSIALCLARRAEPEPPGPARVLARLAADVRLFRSADGRTYAQLPIGGRREIFGLDSAGFRDWLIDGYLRELKEPPSNACALPSAPTLERGPGSPRGFPRFLCASATKARAMESIA